MTAKINLLVTHVNQALGEEHARWRTPSGYEGVSLAILDSIYSTGNHYTGVQRLVRCYRNLREEEGSKHSKTEGPDALINAFETWGGVEAFVERTGYRWRCWSRKTAPFKAEAALAGAQILHDSGIATINDARKAFASREERENSPIAEAWLQIPGQRSGLTWNYFLMLTGLPGVKADRMVRRFVTTALQSENTVSAKEASRLVEAAADRIGVDYSTLDHTIWRYTSDRPFLLPF